eukprot:1160088-Pelagomonas_calceolata.AAC.2
MNVLPPYSLACAQRMHLQDVSRMGSPQPLMAADAEVQSRSLSNKAPPQLHAAPGNVQLHTLVPVLSRMLETPGQSVTPVPPAPAS